MKRLLGSRLSTEDPVPTLNEHHQRQVLYGRTKNSDFTQVGAALTRSADINEGLLMGQTCPPYQHSTTTIP